MIAQACSSGALVLALIWGVAALVLPWLVRGRSLQSDVVAGDRLGRGPRRRHGRARGDGSASASRSPRRTALVPGAIVAGALALALAHRRPPPPDDSLPEES